MFLTELNIRMNRLFPRRNIVTKSEGRKYGKDYGLAKLFNVLFYNFDFTQADFGLFVEPEFDANLIPLELVQAQVFRIVVIPTDFGTSSKMDQSNISSVLNALDIDEKDISRIEL